MLPFWQMQGISKRYGGVLALDDVDFACQRGAIHAVLGENGAGKSTLIKIAAGVVTPSAGRLMLEGRTVRFAGPQDAHRSEEHTTELQSLMPISYALFCLK